MAWALVNGWTYSTPVAQVDFTGLGTYTDVLVLVRNVTVSASGWRSLRVSTDNGSTFLSTTGDYVGISSAGVESNAIASIHATAAATVRSGAVAIYGFNLTSPKILDCLSRTDTNTFIIPTTSALNAVRIFDTAAGNLTGGNIYVYAR